jgi:hypothetical protein
MSADMSLIASTNIVAAIAAATVFSPVQRHRFPPRRGDRRDRLEAEPGN